MANSNLQIVDRPASLGLEDAQAQTLLCVREVSEQNEALRGLVLALSAEVAQVTGMLREMVTLTGSQEAAIKAAAIARARTLCAQYGLQPRAYTKVAAQIRADVVRPSGVRAVRDIPRIEFAQALEQAQSWDKPGAMRRLKREAGER